MKKLTTAILAATLSFPVMATNTDNVRIGTGTEGGKYWEQGQQVSYLLKRKSINSEVLPSNGSVQNVEDLNDGDVDMIVVQADTLNVHPINVSYTSRPVHKEYVLWLYNKKNGYKDIEDIEGSEDKLIVLVEDSGAVTTLQSFVKEDGGYKTNLQKAIYAETFYDAAEIVADGKYEGKTVAGMLYVGGKVPKGDEGVTDFSNAIAVGEATDGDFNDAEDVNGDSLYTNCSVDKQHMGGLESGTLFSPDTVCLRAMIVSSKEHTQFKQMRRAVNKVSKRYN